MRLDASGEEQHGDSDHLEHNDMEGRSSGGQGHDFSHLNSEIREEHCDHRHKKRA